jgi:hypothetical protein
MPAAAAAALMDSVLATDRNCHFSIFSVSRRNTAFTPISNYFANPNITSNQNFSATPTGKVIISDFSAVKPWVFADFPRAKEYNSPTKP